MTLGRFLSQTLRILVLAAIVLFASHGLASAQSRSSRFGLGGMVGEPTGLSMKLRLSPAFAIDFGVGFGGFGPGYGQVHADFLGAVNLTEHSRAGMDIYFGGGPRLAFADHGGSRWRPWRRRPRVGVHPAAPRRVRRSCAHPLALAGRLLRRGRRGRRTLLVLTRATRIAPGKPR